MARPRLPVLAVLLATSVVVTAIILGFAWAITTQQRTIDQDARQKSLELVADSFAAAIRGRVEESSERLAAWLADATVPPDSSDRIPLFSMRSNTTTVRPRGALAFLPVVPTIPTSALVAKGELLEFVEHDLTRAAAEYRSLTNSRDIQVQAAAWLRLGRVLRQAGDSPAAMSAYTSLASFHNVVVDGFDAGLAGLEGQRDLFQRSGNQDRADAIGRLITRGIEEGRWLINRGTAELYLGQINEDAPRAVRLAWAIAEVFTHEDTGHSRGTRLVDAGSKSIVVLWCGSASSLVVLAGYLNDFFASIAPTSVAWTLSETDMTSNLDSRGTRVIGGADRPWTLRVQPSAQPAPSINRTALLVTIAPVMFVWAATYFMAKAIARESPLARLQTDFVASVSHEFRSPLTTVRQMSEMLNTGRVSDVEKQREYYGVLVHEARRLQRLVETLLNFGRLDAGHVRYRLQPTDLASVVASAVSDMHDQASRAGARIEVVGPTAPVQAKADADALRLAVRNLIENAIRYSPEQPHVAVRWYERDQWASIDVEDRGRGIDSDEVHEIFRKFVRGRAARDLGVTGTGIGLAMVQQIVTAHGGEVRVRSKLHEGSTFTISVPVVS